MNGKMVISIMSKDRPGIIADVTGVIFDLKGDLADLRQSVLDGYLTMILMANFPDNVTEKDLLDRFSAVKSDVKIEAIVKSIEPPTEPEGILLAEKTYVVTAQGKNKSGLVYGISSFCCERGINIIDLTTTLADDQYTMILQLDLSQIDNISTLHEELSRFAEDAGLNVVMQHYDIFKVTNEVGLI